MNAILGWYTFGIVTLATVLNATGLFFGKQSSAKQKQAWTMLFQIPMVIYLIQQLF